MFLANHFRAVRVAGSGMMENTSCDLIAGNKNAKYASLIESFKPNVVICFGIDSMKINLPFEIIPYQIHSNQQITFLLASSLEDLAKNIDEKKVLWGCLKNIFSI